MSVLSVVQLSLWLFMAGIVFGAMGDREPRLPYLVDLLGSLLWPVFAVGVVLIKIFGGKRK